MKPVPLMRPALVAVAVAAAFTTAVPVAQAQSPSGAFPQRPMRLILSVPPGGAADFTGRVVAAKMGELAGQTVVVESRPGAGGIVASEFVTKATPDGHTLMLSSSTTHGAAPVLYRKLPYDAIRSFTHISGVSLLPAMMAINADVPAKTVKEFVAVTRASPGKYMFSSSGNGSAPQLFGENFKIRTGADLTHVPYKGSGPAVVDLAGGQVHMMMDGLPSLINQIKSGRLRAMAALADKRFSVFPDVPTIAEAGFPGLEDGVWYGMSAPAGVPAPIVDILAKLTLRTITSPDVVERFQTVGGIPLTIGPKEYVAFIQNYNKRWGEIVRVAKVVAD
jgi:tripartite-type tricarboxylate transporter receptor subunit TctC